MKKDEEEEEDECVNDDVAHLSLFEVLCVAFTCGCVYGVVQEDSCS